MIIRILESSLQSWSLFFLGKHLCIILAPDKKGKFLKRGRRMIPRALYGRNLWGVGNVDTVYCSCTVKQLPGLCVCLGWWTQVVREDESLHLFALWRRKEWTFPFLVKVTFSKRERTVGVGQYLQSLSTIFPSAFIQMFVALKPCMYDCNWIFANCSMHLCITTWRYNF